MRIHRKISALLFLVLAGFSAASYWVVDAQIAPTFDELQSSLARNNLLRAERALTAEFDSLKAITGDWAPWGDPYRFLKGRNPGFVAANLDANTIANLDLDLMAFIGNDLRVAWGATLDPDPTALSPLPGDWIVATQLERLTEHDTTRDELSGLVMTPNGPLMISARPVVTNNYGGPIAGTLIVGRLLSAKMVANLRRRIEVDVGFVELTTVDPRVTDQLAEGNEADAAEAVVTGQADGSLLAYRPLPDLRGDLTLAMVVATPLKITELGAAMSSAAALSLAAAALLAGAVLWLVLRQTVVGPLESLADDVQRIRTGGDLSMRLQSARSDEIGQLARRFDELLGEFENARSHLLDQSYRAGISEAARGVLHNIRNSLTPLVFRAESARKLNEGTAERIDQVLDELGDSTLPDPRRGKLLDYLRLSMGSTEKLRDAVDTELEAVADQARQIEEILADQERVAHESPILENVALLDALVEAAAVVPTREDITVELDPAVHLQRVRVHRAGLAQILGNVFLNAYEAISRAGQGGRISVRVERDDPLAPMVRVRIRDDGVGIGPAELDRLFVRGYTSKTDSRGGLGLHWCANTIAAMGGAIRARSDGPGSGAEFELMLPSAANL